MENQKFIIIFFTFMLLCAGCLMITMNNGLVADESAHAIQIQHFVNGEWLFLKTLTVPPTYHLVVTMLAIPLGVSSLPGLRVISCLLLVLLIVPIAYLITKKDLNKTIQILFFPTMFLYYMLIYTDIFSLIFVMFSYYLMTQKRYVLSGLTGTFALFIRQNNIFWVSFILFYGLLHYAKDNNFKDIKRLNDINRDYLTYLFVFVTNYFKKVWMFIVGGLAFVGFLLFSGAVVQGDASQHPITFHFGNIWMCLFVFFFAFLPYNLSNIKNIIECVKKNYWIGVSTIFVFIGVMFFESTHLYNEIPGVWFNNLLQLINTNGLVQFGFAVICSLGFISIVCTRFKNNFHYWMYPTTVLYLGMSWLIEARYYFIPMILFLVFYTQQNKKLEVMTTIYYVLIALLWYSTLIVNPY